MILKRAFKRQEWVDDPFQPGQIFPTPQGGGRSPNRRGYAHDRQCESRVSASRISSPPREGWVGERETVMTSMIGRAWKSHETVRREACYILAASGRTAPVCDPASGRRLPVSGRRHSHPVIA